MKYYDVKLVLPLFPSINFVPPPNNYMAVTSNKQVFIIHQHEKEMENRVPPVNYKICKRITEYLIAHLILIVYQTLYSNKRFMLCKGLACKVVWSRGIVDCVSISLPICGVYI